MPRPLLLAIATAAMLLGLGAEACEKHLNGHQNGSDSSIEASQK